MKVVTAFRPFAPESPAHKRLGTFDWVGAIAMLRESVRQSCRCGTYVVTDWDAVGAVPGPAHAYATHERRLMLWLLEVWTAYLASPDFNEDTVTISPDALVYEDLRPWFLADLGVVVRPGPKFAERKPLLNGCQFWRVAAKDRLVAFYREACTIAQGLSENAKRWGADTEPLVQLLAPLKAGHFERNGLTVYGLDRQRVFQGITMQEERCLALGKPVHPTAAITDFKSLRKLLMRPYFDATYGARVPA